MSFDSAEQESAAPRDDSVPRFKLLCLIAPWHLKEDLLEELSAHECGLIKVMHGIGGYHLSHNLLDFIPVSSSEKLVVISLCKEENLPRLYNQLNDQFAFNQKDSGIVFSMNVDEIAHKSKGRRAIERNSPREKEKIKMKFLYVIVNDGFSGDILNLLDEAGAGGSTIVPARGWNGSGRVLGVPIEPAKEIVMSVVSDEICAIILDKTSAAGALPDAANCIAVSLEVDGVNDISKFMSESV
jgi:hypothetical protein